MNSESILQSSLLRAGTTGAVMLGAASLHGAVVYNNFPDLTIGPQGSQGNPNGGYYGSVKFDPITLSITTTGPSSYYINSAIFTTYSFDSKFGASPANRSGGSYTDGSTMVSTGLLAAGTQINASTTFTLGSTALPGNLSNAYEGVKITGSSGNVYYGWVHFSTGANANGNVANGANTAILLDAAFESTPNTPIAAGATTNQVPEPSTVALLTLAGGVVAFKLRRNLASAKAAR